MNSKILYSKPFSLGTSAGKRIFEAVRAALNLNARLYFRIYFQVCVCICSIYFQVCVHNFLDQFVPSYIERVFRILIEMFLVIISISIYNFGIYLILVLSICNAIQSADCHVRYFNKLSIYLSISKIRDFWPQKAEHCI